MVPSIHIYGESSLLSLEEILDYLKGLFPKFKFDLRDDFFTHHLNLEILDPVAQRLATIRVLNPMKKALNPYPIYGEIDYEKRKLLNPLSSSIGVFYDGIRLQAILYCLLKKEERGFEHIHIAVTKQLIATWDESDLRYHLRVGVYGHPSIVSLSGAVEAPAKPREFYILKQMGIKKRFDGRFIDYGDSRISEVIKGYLIQAILYHLRGEAFCSDRGCRLFNAHWQEEMLYAQIESPYEFCDRHNSMIKEMMV